MDKQKPKAIKIKGHVYDRLAKFSTAEDMDIIDMASRLLTWALNVAEKEGLKIGGAAAAPVVAVEQPKGTPEEREREILAVIEQSKKKAETEGLTAWTAWTASLEPHIQKILKPLQKEHRTLAARRDTINRIKEREDKDDAIDDMPDIPDRREVMVKQGQYAAQYYAERGQEPPDEPPKKK